MDAAREHLVSDDIHKAQVRLYNKIASMDEDSLLRKLVCEPGGNTPRTWHLKRKRGRAKQVNAGLISRS